MRLKKRQNKESRGNSKCDTKPPGGSLKAEIGVCVCAERGKQRKRYRLI